MKGDDNAPAETRSMGIVHSALRRDLARLQLVLGESPGPDERRRAAIVAHTVWMMEFLHGHHTGEDVGLWPAVRARNPYAVELLDQMDEDHQRIAPAITALEDAARAYGKDPQGLSDFTGALATLSEVLLPHLRREELEMMPVVSQTLTTREFDDIEQTYFVGPKSTLELADEGHWLIDGLDNDSREHMLGVVPWPMRQFLLYGFGPRYRRKRRLLWGDGPAAAVPSLSVALLDQER